MAFVTVAHALHAAEGQVPTCLWKHKAVPLGLKPTSRKTMSALPL